MSEPLFDGGWMNFWASGAIVRSPPPLTEKWYEMNWASCWPQSPPPESENGEASGVKNTPESRTPAPPLIWYLLLLVSDQSPSWANGPSVAASHVGGAPPATFTTPPFWTTVTCWALKVPPVKFMSPLRR